MKQRGSGKKVANSLVAASSAAVLAVYAAGYVRTRSAADRLEAQTAGRRPALPAPPRNASPIPELPRMPLVPAPPKRPAEKPAAPKADVPEVAADAAPLPLPVESSSPLVAVAPVAPAPEPEAAPAPAAATPQWKDGTYLGWGHCRHGDIQARVVIEGGRIQSAKIAQCLTRYSCEAIDSLPPQVVKRQSPEVDYVSGATQSTDAYYYAVVDALSNAK